MGDTHGATFPEPGISMVDLAKRFGITLAAVGDAVKRGEEIAEEGGDLLEAKPQRCINLWPKSTTLALYKAIKERLSLFKTAILCSIRLRP